MKNNNILNTILVGIVVCTIGYIIYIQSKQGIIVNGTDEVIDPFLYDTGVFNDTRTGVNPYSTVYHITQEELQARKTKKILNVGLILIPAIVILILINRKKEEENTEYDNVKDVIDEDSNDELVKSSISIGEKYKNFKSFCKSLKELSIVLKVNTKNELVFSFPIKTFNEVLLNKKWDFYFGLKEKHGKKIISLSCISKKGEVFDLKERLVGDNDLTIEEYGNIFQEMYIEFLSNPKYGLITTNQI